jgi:hypothetical protein
MFAIFLMNDCSGTVEFGFHTKECWRLADLLYPSKSSCWWAIISMRARVVKMITYMGCNLGKWPYSKLTKAMIFLTGLQYHGVAEREQAYMRTGAKGDLEFGDGL